MGESGDGSSILRWLSFLSGLPMDRRKRRIVAVMQAYVDDSASNEVFVFSALIQEATRWGAVADRWAGILAESPSIQYFKMDEADGTNGQFYGFSAPERDEKVRRLCKVVNDADLTELSFTTDKKSLERAWGTPRRPPFSEPYFFAFQALIWGVGYELYSRGQREPFEIFFDEDLIFGPRAKAWYPIIRMCVDKEIQDILPVEPFFRDDIDVPVLQAADLTAWIARKEETKETHQFLWALPLLNNVCRSAYSRKVDERFFSTLGKVPNDHPEYIARKEAMVRAYRDTFGHDWPPKTKQQLKRFRGR